MYPKPLGASRHHWVSLSALQLGTENGTVRLTYNTRFNYLNPVALKNIGWKYYIVCDVIIVLNIATVYWTYPETKGKLKVNHLEWEQS